jgi:RNA recognition motif-containing protein
MNLYISNLSFHIIESDLTKLFSVYGQVGFVVILRQKETGRSNGNAFLEMPVQAQGEQAIRALHHKEVDGQKISVREIEHKAGDFNN